MSNNAAVSDNGGVGRLAAVMSKVFLLSLYSEKKLRRKAD